MREPPFPNPGGPPPLNPTSPPAPMPQPAPNPAPTTVPAPPTPMAPTLVQNGIGFGALAGGTAAFNQTGVFDPETEKLAIVLNIVAQVIKWPKFVNEHFWLVPTMFVIGVVLIWLMVQHDLWRALTVGAQGTFKALMNYESLNLTALKNVFPSVPEANSHPAPNWKPAIFGGPS